MVERLDALDASFLYLEEGTTPLHSGGLAIFESAGEVVDANRLAEIVSSRLYLVPRYRQRVRNVLGGVSTPVWVDDENFDLSYHLRRTALPRPGNDEQLHELVARVLSRPLDHARPLWEIYLVEGLQDGRFALITKTHQALVDGVSAIEIGEVLFDDAPEVDDHADEAAYWLPQREPSTLRLTASAVADLVHRPGSIVRVARSGVADVTRSLTRVSSAAGEAFKMARTVARTSPSSPLNVDIGQARRFATATFPLETFRKLHRGFDASTHDVVLATVAGALRTWLQMRGEPVTSRATVRALVPVSVTDGEAAGPVATVVLDLPVGEPSPAIRVHQIAFNMRAALQDRHTVGARRLAGLAGFAPPTLHAVGARMAAGLSHRMFNLLVTNAPGPQQPRYLAGARLVEAYPVAPLTKGQALSIGVTSYDGQVFFGLFADRDALPDIDVLGDCLSEAIDELVEAL